MQGNMFSRGIILICWCLGFIYAECQNGWVRFDDYCYLFSHSKLNFADSEQFCNQHGGHLVHIETQRENDNLRNYCMYDLHVARRWIGITDQVTEGRWELHGTDTEIVFKDWASGEPNDADKANCVVLWDERQYHWADEACHHMHESICEVPLNSEVEVVG